MSKPLRTIRKKEQRESRSSAVVAPEPLLLDIRGAAQALSATPWAIRSLLWDKQIPYIKIGRRFLIDPADLRAYIVGQKGGAQ